MENMGVIPLTTVKSRAIPPLIDLYTPVTHYKDCDSYGDGKNKGKDSSTWRISPFISHEWPFGRGTC